MKILIDIPEEEYKNLAYANHFKLRSYIENGEVLPKGHGALKDADALIQELSVVSSRPVKSQLYILREAPTIIDADKEVKHERMD